MKLKTNKFYSGDCIEIMKQWEDDCVDHCITDPPYNLSKENGLAWAYSSHVTPSEDWDIFPRDEYIQFSKDWISEVRRVVKPNGNIFIFGSFHNIYDVGYILNEMNTRIINSITWFKPNAQPNITCRTLTESTEHVIWACNEDKEKATKWVFNYEDAKKLNGGKQMRNMWSMPYTRKSEKEYGSHPTQKPIDLISRIMLIATNKNDVVLDCFSGSGTTAVVAKSFKRKWVMIDQNAEFVKLGKKRVKKVRVPIPNELIQLPLFDD